MQTNDHLQIIQQATKQVAILIAFTFAGITAYFGWVSTSHAAVPFFSQDGKKTDHNSYPSLAPMLEQVSPAVVNISTFTKRQQNNPLFNDPFFRHFFNIPDNYRQQPRQKRSRAAGSGVIIDAKKGTVITNHHVIDGADEIEVSLLDGRTFIAKLTGSDPEVDLAVLEIEPKNLTDIPVANSDELRVGDYVAAIGNPFGLGQTVTTGIVSALGRSGLGIEGYENFIQTDASINPGNSGGALVNLKGELIGINTAIIAPSGGNVGIGFAIPTNMAQAVTEQLLENGEVQRGQLGIIIQDLTPELAEAFNVKDRRHGAVIAEVRPGSAAEKGGLLAGDIIIEINNKKIRNSAQLRNNIGLRKIGEKINIRLIRNAKKQTITLNIGQAEPNHFSGKSGPKSQKDDVLDKRLAGAVFTNSNNNRGVLVSKIEASSPASYAGLQEYDLIVTVNHKDVRQLDDFKRELKLASDRLLLRVVKNGVF